MKALLGTKLGMTSIFDETGQEVGATAVQVLDTKVVRVKTAESDGYEAVQVSADAGRKRGPVVKEFPKPSDASKAGDTLGLDQLEAGERVKVSAVSKGKGFQGTIKRHNFSRGPMTHGSRNQRPPGSIGGTGAQRVFAGQKMPGRMGNERVTQRNLRIAAIHADDNLLLLDGSVPGPTGSLVEITSDAPAKAAESTGQAQAQGEEKSE